MRTLIALACVSAGCGRMDSPPAGAPETATSAAASPWQLDDDPNAARGPAGVRLLVGATADLLTPSNQRFRPVLIVRCYETRIEIFVNAVVPLAVEELREAQLVRIRIDSTPPVAEDWPVTPGRDKLAAPLTSALLAELGSAKEMRVEFTIAEGGTRETAFFPVAGLDAALRLLPVGCAAR